MNVQNTRDDVVAFGVDDGSAVSSLSEVPSNGRDLFSLDANIGLASAARAHDQATLDDCVEWHRYSPYVHPIRKSPSGLHGGRLLDFACASLLGCCWK